MSHESPNFPIHDPNLEIRSMLEVIIAHVQSEMGMKMSRPQAIRFLTSNFIRRNVEGK